MAMMMVRVVMMLMKVMNAMVDGDDDFVDAYRDETGSYDKRRSAKTKRKQNETNKTTRTIRGGHLRGVALRPSSRFPRSFVLFHSFRFVFVSFRFLPDQLS